MSEQSNQYRHNRSPQEAEFGNGDIIDLQAARKSLHRYETTKARQQVEQIYSIPSPETQEKKHPVVEVHELLINLHQERLAHMRPEDTPFLKDQAA